MQFPSRIATVRGALAVSAVAAAVLAGLSIGGGLSMPGPEQQALVPAAPVMKALPGLTVATTDTPHLDSLDAAGPAPGEVVQGAGPFDDRFELRNLGFDGAVVSGAVDITSDVSELLELEVAVGFYDVGGALIGEGTFVLPESGGAHSHGGVPEESQAFDVPVPEGLVGHAASAAVGIPVLVNE